MFERLQAKFFKGILGLPRCAPYAATCLELGQSLLETRVWQLTFKYWLRVLFRTSQDSLLHLMISEHDTPMWLTRGWKKIEPMGLLFDLLAMSSEMELFSKVKQTLVDIKFQTLSQVTHTCSPLNFHIPFNPQSDGSLSDSFD